MLARRDWLISLVLLWLVAAVWTPTRFLPLHLLPWILFALFAILRVLVWVFQEEDHTKERWWVMPGFLASATTVIFLCSAAFILCVGYAVNNGRLWSVESRAACSARPA